MSQPHHHVFNALQRSIIRSGPIQPLLPLLLEKGVIKKEEVKMFDSKAHGMKILTSYLRNRDFDTFLKFVECFCEVEEREEGFEKMEVSIVDSILNAVEDFDAKHPDKAGNAEKVEEIIQKWRKPALLSTPTGAEEGTCDTGGAELAELSMPLGIPFISEPVTATLTFDNPCYHDPELDFSISMPEGSIGKEECIQFRIGACCYGPFAIPDRYLLVTDIFCVVASAQFGQGRTATVTMSHCLQMAIYQQHDALFILKADHKTVTKSGKFFFERLTNPEVVSDSPYLITFKINNFCILCGVLEPRSSDSSSSESSFSRQSSLVESEPGLARTYSTDSETGKAYSRECSVESGTGAPAEPYPQTSTPETRSRSSSKRSSRKGRQQTPYSHVQARKPDTTIEYAVILYEPVKLETSLRWPLIVFVCIFCPGITAECKKQAQRIMKKRGFDDVEQTKMYVTIEQDIELIPVSKGTGWKIDAKVSPPVIKQSLVNVQGLIKSMGKQNVAKMVENQEYPERMVFTVSLDESGMLSDGAEAKIEVHGVQRNDGTNHFFKIELPTSQGKKPSQTLQLQMTDSQYSTGHWQHSSSVMAGAVVPSQPLAFSGSASYLPSPVYPSPMPPDLTSAGHFSQPVSIHPHPLAAPLDSNSSFPPAALHSSCIPTASYSSLPATVPYPYLPPAGSYPFAPPVSANLHAGSYPFAPPIPANPHGGSYPSVPPIPANPHGGSYPFVPPISANQSMAPHTLPNTPLLPHQTSASFLSPPPFSSIGQDSRDPVSGASFQEQHLQALDRLAISDSLSTSDQPLTGPLPVAPPDNSAQPTNMLSYETSSLSAQALPFQHRPQQQEFSRSCSLDQYSSCHQPQASNSNLPMPLPDLNEYLNRIPEELQDKEVERDHVVCISYDIKNLKQTGRCLGLSDATIQRFCSDQTETLVGHAYNILWNGWIQQRPTNPTYKKLIEGLYKATEHEAIEKLLQLVLSAD